MSTEPQARTIWSNIQANNGFTKDLSEAVNKVIAGGYAVVIDEVAVIPFITLNPEKLMLAPGALVTTFDGIAVKRGL